MDHRYEDIIISVSEEDHVVISTKKNDRSITDSTHLLKPSLLPVTTKHISHECVVLVMCGSYLCLWWLLS